MPSEKSAHRLGRLFRNAKPKLNQRDWIEPGQEAERAKLYEGMPSDELSALVAGLSEKDLELAQKGADPGVASDAAIEARLGRFGNNASILKAPGNAGGAKSAGNNGAVVAPALTNADVQAMQERQSRWGTAGTSLTVASAIAAATSTPVDEEALKAREARWAAANAAKAGNGQTALSSEELAKREARFSGKSAPAPAPALTPEEEAALAARAARFTK
jgi:hypothetical protein